MIARLHYISQETPEYSHIQAVEAACRSGCRWIQLRVKERTYEEYETIAREAMDICRQYEARLIINDNVSIAQQVKSHGVHLGKQDMPAEKARELLGGQVIIGGTANTFEDIQQLAQAGVDYIGLGPFRFTTTKKNLSPVLGLEGYRQLLTQCKDCAIDIPVIAIGGIGLADVLSLRQAGIHGVAVSGAITHAADKTSLIQHFLTQLDHADTTNC